MGSTTGTYFLGGITMEPYDNPHPHHDRDADADASTTPRRGPSQLCWRRVSAAVLVISSAACLALLVSGVLDTGLPVPLTASLLIVCLAVGAVLRSMAVRRVRAEHAALVYLLGSRLADIEAQRRRDAEIIHEARATLHGVSNASRLLTERSDELGRDTTMRLEQLRQAELGRLERLLTRNARQRIETVSIDEVVDPLVDSVALRGHDVQWEPTGESVTGNADDISEVVHILLENATRHAPYSEITVSTARSGDRVTITVSDTGPGVAPHLGVTVFDRGVRSESSEGDGLGLAAGRRIARQMNGDLRLVMGRTAGAAFAFDLPAAVVADVPCPARSA